MSSHPQNPDPVATLTTPLRATEQATSDVVLAVESLRATLRAGRGCRGRRATGPDMGASPAASAEAAADRSADRARRTSVPAVEGGDPPLRSVPDDNLEDGERREIPRAAADHRENGRVAGRGCRELGPDTDARLVTV